MPSYDPQRSRARRRTTDDDGPAPVDALLGPAPDETAPAGEGTPAPERREPLVVDLDGATPVTVPDNRGRLVLYALVALSIVVQIVLILRWRRRRRSRD